MSVIKEIQRQIGDRRKGIGEVRQTKAVLLNQVEDRGFEDQGQEEETWK